MTNTVKVKPLHCPAATSASKPADLVTVEHGQPVTTTERIAAAAGLKHASVIKLVRKHRERLEKFGPIRFEIRMGNRGGVPVEYASLCERQATLLFTWLRNTPAVLDGKFRLVDAFFRTAAELQRLKAMQSAPEWQASRIDTKRGYRFLSDVVRETREGTEKPADRNTFIHEARVIAFAMTGEYMAVVERDKLPPDELRLLDSIQMRSAVLFARGLSRKDRQHILRGVVLHARADRAALLGAVQ